jgi:hypothetical protein
MFCSIFLNLSFFVYYLSIPILFIFTDFDFWILGSAWENGKINFSKPDICSSENNFPGNKTSLSNGPEKPYP